MLQDKMHHLICLANESLCIVFEAQMVWVLLACVYDAVDTNKMVSIYT